MRSPSTHESLLARLAEGEGETAWADFCERYGDLIRSYGRKRGLQAADCDDLLQNVLFALSKSMPGFRYDPSKGRLRAYLKAVTMRTLSRLPRQNQDEASLEDVEEPRARDELAWEEAWREHHVRRALTRLRARFPERTLAAFELYVLEGREVREVGELLGTSDDVVYQAKSRVLRELSGLVAEQVAEEG